MELFLFFILIFSESRKHRQGTFAIARGSKIVPLNAKPTKVNRRGMLVEDDTEFPIRKRPNSDPYDYEYGAKRARKMEEEIPKPKFTDLNEILFPEEYEVEQQRQKDRKPTSEKPYHKLTIKPSYERRRKSFNEDDDERYNKQMGVINPSDTEDDVNTARKKSMDPKILVYDGRPIGRSRESVDSKKKSNAINHFKGFELDKPSEPKRQSVDKNRKSMDSRSSRDGSNSKSIDNNSTRKSSGNNNNNRLSKGKPISEVDEGESFQTSYFSCRCKFLTSIESQ